MLSRSTPACQDLKCLFETQDFSSRPQSSDVCEASYMRPQCPIISTCFRTLYLLLGKLLPVSICMAPTLLRVMCTIAHIPCHDALAGDCCCICKQQETKTTLHSDVTPCIWYITKSDICNKCCSSTLLGLCLSM